MRENIKKGKGKKEFTKEERRMLEDVELEEGEKIIRIYSPFEHSMEEPKLILDGSKKILGGIIVTNRRFIFLKLEGFCISSGIFPGSILIDYVIRNKINDITRKFRKYVSEIIMPIKDINKIESKRHILMKNILLLNNYEFFMHFDLVEEIEKTLKDLIEGQKSSRK